MKNAPSPELKHAVDAAVSAMLDHVSGGTTDVEEAVGLLLDVVGAMDGFVVAGGKLYCETATCRAAQEMVTDRAFDKLTLIHGEPAEDIKRAMLAMIAERFPVRQ
jgi:hypothetical protein